MLNELYKSWSSPLRNRIRKNEYNNSNNRCATDRRICSLFSHPVSRNSIKRELFPSRTRRILLIKQRSGPHGKSREINVNLFPIHATFSAPIKKSAAPNTSLLHTNGLVREHSPSKEEHSKASLSFMEWISSALFGRMCSGPVSC